MTGLSLQTLLMSESSSRVYTHHEGSDGGPSLHCVVPVGETSGILTLSESLSRVYTRHAVSDKGSYRCGSPTAAARNRHPEDALDVLARAACPRIGAPESLPPIAGACHPALPLPSPQWVLSQTFARQREHWALASARSEGLRGQREERDMFPQPRPVDCDHCPPLSSSGWSWSGIETGTMATEARCECSLREFAAICPFIGDRVGRVRLVRVLLYDGWVGTMTDGSGGLLLITFND
jgi:hypothetical protein